LARDEGNSGFDESLLNEALLIIPTVEYFKSLANSPEWKLRGEWHEPGKSLVNIDLIAEHAAGIIFLEFKYLKNANDQRLIRDFVKLASADSAGYTRLLLVAHSPSGHFGDQSKSELVKTISSAGRPTAFRLTKREAVLEVTSDLNIRKHPLTGKVQESVCKIMKDDPLLSAFTVELAGNCRRAKQNVSVFLILRV
jgi:hypothetical protein